MLAGRTLELFEALMVIISQREHQKTSDPRGASAWSVFLSEVQMIHLLEGKVRDWFYVRESKYENIFYSIQKIFDVSSHELLVLKFIGDSRLVLESKWNPDMNGGATFLVNWCWVCLGHPWPWKRWVVLMNKTSQINEAGTNMETQEISFYNSYFFFFFIVI